MRHHIELVYDSFMIMSYTYIRLTKTVRTRHAAAVGLVWLTQKNGCNKYKFNSQKRTFLRFKCTGLISFHKYDII